MVEARSVEVQHLGVVPYQTAINQMKELQSMRIDDESLIRCSS
jgi:hypothetical protein